MIVDEVHPRLDIGLSFHPRCASPLVTDRETRLIVVGAPSDRTAIAGTAPTSRKRKPRRDAGAGPQRAPTVNLGTAESQARRLSALRPRAAKAVGAGFESHLLRYSPDLLIAPPLPHQSDLPARAANQLPEVGPDQPNRIGLPHDNR
jgi:hypothetical protein